MAFSQLFFLVLVLLASSVVLGRAEAGEATESTSAVKTASRKLLPVGAEIVKVLGVADGLRESCAHAGESCFSNPWVSCPGCVCVWPTYTCIGTC